jgi:prepilin-type N-terminal cleavage/methylation domain-containing protein
MTPRFATRTPGFTLIELMITLAVLTSMVLVVYPTYLSYSRETGRGDAYTALLDLATREEHYYNAYDTYTDVVVAPRDCAGEACGLAASNVSSDGYYKLSATAGSTGNIATSFLLTATVQSDREQAGDAPCAVLTINSLGATTPIECW